MLSTKECLQGYKETFLKNIFQLLRDKQLFLPLWEKNTKKTNKNQLPYSAALHTTVGTSLPQLTGRLEQYETVRYKT